ncbi:DUF3653 domain-containing protein [Paenibacillus motobuensis]|uniref:Helix-turn-helix domain-containing protein n=1 Tax=Paenibacillus motobuensis TaxID=295324 RepID=A0ABN0YHM6_9BACL
MNNDWIGTGDWSGWKISGNALISPSGREYKPEDVEPREYTQADLAKALGVTRGAIADRLRRGTLPPFDHDKKWKYETIRHLLP